ncbi:sulfite exporter TauE/SafE family protein [Candidatus Roizmanbacteria bacterium]|nr:sulfite exporter TauE/SafE family protein [Candidatus Roizmanbacteria bacterium]
MSKIKKTTLHIQGMHCPSCDILIQDKTSELSNVVKVKANYKNQKAEVEYVGSFGDREIGEVNRRIQPFGYRVLRDEERGVADIHEPLSKRLFDAGAIAVILFILFFFAQELNLVPNFNTNAGLTLTTALILGLVASTSTCMATSGALFLATIGKGSSDNKLIPTISFNAGRVLSYAFFGFLAGFVGKAIAFNFQLSSLLTLVVSILMVLVGLDMAKVFSIQTIFAPSFTKGIFLSLEKRFIKNPKKTGFFLGAITYFLPCGFTQTVQLYALGLADPIKSSLIMAIFALGTVPALMAIGFATSLTKSSFYPTVQKVMGTLVFLIGMYYFNNFLGLYGVNVNIASPIKAKQDFVQNNVLVKDNVQVASMNVNFSGYYPSRFTVKKNVPVRWEINGENVFGCQGYLVAPKLGIQKTLALGKNVIEFTPKEEGTIGFSCGMGMYTGSFTVVGS